MPSVAEANIAFDVAALVMLAVMFWQIIIGGRGRRDWEFIMAAALLHAGALMCAIGVLIPAMYDVSPSEIMVWLAIGLEVFSVLAFAACILVDSDGHLRLLDRKAPFSPPVIGWAIGPSAIVGATWSFAGGVNLLGMAYAASLCIVLQLMARMHERELARREAELESGRSKLLAEQMSPHFIFNSLTSISSLCYTDSDAAAQAVADLSGYLRGNINALSSDDPIPFETELAHIRQYVALEQADPARAFAMEYDLEAEPFLIPALTVQPLVENAVKHGALTRKDGSGRVRLATEDHGRYVRVIVEDNGTGDVRMEGLPHDGVGLQSVEKRLAGFGGSLRVSIGDDGARACAFIPRKGRD